MTQNMTENTPAPQVWPTLRAADARALVRFLVDALGFEETAVYGEGDRVDHAELAWPPGGGIMLGSARDSDAADSWPQRPGCFGAYAVTDDPDALFARATAAGAKVAMDLHDTDYGSREFAVTDPEGNHWSFGTYRGAPRDQPRSGEPGSVTRDRRPHLDLMTRLRRRHFVSTWFDMTLQPGVSASAVRLSPPACLCSDSQSASRPARSAALRTP